MKLTKKPETKESILNGVAFDETVAKLQGVGVIQPAHIATFINSAKTLKGVGARKMITDQKNENDIQF